MKDDILDKIDDYLMGYLSPEDKAAFEKDIAADEELAAAVAVQKLQHRAWQLAERDTLRSEMADWKKEKTTNLSIEMPLKSEETGAKVVSMSRRIYQLAAAASVLLVVAFVANWLFFSIPSDAELFKKYYDEPSFTTKGNAELTPLDEAIRYIETQNYNEAIRVLESINDASLNTQKLFLLSHCYFKKADYSHAISALETVINQSNDISSIQQAEWKIVLIQLTAGQKNATFKSLLNKIANDPNHAYQSKASDLSKQLKL